MFEYSKNYNKIVKIRAKEGLGGVKKIVNQMTRIDLENFACLTLNNHFIDPSTGTLRELASIFLSGAKNDEGQHGYDGWRGNLPIECKPVIHYKNGSPKSANGHGSINDHSMKRHLQFTEDDLIMQQSQFFDGICAWIIEFPYTDSKFYLHMEKQLRRGDDPKENLRRVCGRFTYKHWWESPNLVIRYINKELIRESRLQITGGRYNKLLYQWLMNQ